MHFLVHVAADTCSCNPSSIERKYIIVGLNYETKFEGSDSEMIMSGITQTENHNTGSRSILKTPFTMNNMCTKIFEEMSSSQFKTCIRW